MTFTKERQKNTIAIVMAALLSIGGIWLFAPAPVAAAEGSEPQPAYVKADVTIIRDGEILNFFNEKREQVYPVFFRNRTYLPLRALCALLGEEVEWVGDANTIYIGMTLSHPGKQIIKLEDSPFVKKVKRAATGEQSLAKAYIKDDIYILHDYENVKFRDPAGERQYPINVGGTTYLPVSALGEFLGEEITWDGETKTVIIGSREVPVEPVKPADAEKHVKKIAALYEKQAELYNDATQLIMLISSATPDELKLLATAASEKYITAEVYNSEVKSYAREMASLPEKEQLSEEEAAALANLKDFAEFSEHYVMLIENMMHMAADGGDYSVFAETFAEIAQMALRAMNATANSVEIIL